MSNKNRTIYDEFELRGYWYLPSDPDSKVAGILSFSINGIDLELFGLLGNDKYQGAQDAQDVDIILGDCEEKVTLINGFQTALSFGNRVKSQYTFNNMIIGRHFSKRGEISFHSVSVNYSYLEEWMGHNPFVDTHEYDVENSTKVNKVGTTYTFPPIFKTDIPSIQAEVKADYRFNTGGVQFRSRTIEHSCYLTITPSKEEGFNWFLNKVGSLQNLLSLLINFPVFPVRIKAKGDIIKKEYNYREDIDIYLLPMSEYLHKRKLKPNEMLLRLPSLDQQMDQLLNNWFDIETNPAIHLYLEEVYSNINDFQESFVNFSKSLESFHRNATGDNGKYVTDIEYEIIKERIIASLPKDLPNELSTNIKNSFSYAHHFSFRKRVKETTRGLDERISNLLLNDMSVNDFANIVVSNRNYYTHFDKKPDNLLTDWDLGKLSMKVKVMVLFNILKLLGISEDTIYQSIMDSRLYSKITQKFEVN